MRGGASKPSTDGSEKQVETVPHIELTPSDAAAIVHVDEGRKSLGLKPEGGDVGARWIVEHTAKVKADAAPEIAKAAAADEGEEQPESPASGPEK